MSLSPSVQKFSAVAMRLRSGYWRIHAVSRGLLVRDTWRRIGQVDVLILCHDVDRALTVDGKAYSQLLDPVREELIGAGHAVGVVAHRFSVLTGDKAHGSPHSCNRANLVSAVANRLARVVPWMPRVDGMSARAIRFSEKLLLLTEAKVVLLIGAPPELCIAGHRRGVPVVELLHGFRYDQIPWGYDERNAPALPSHILALDDRSLQTFRSLSDRGVQSLRVRHPSLGLPSAGKVVSRTNGEDPLISESQCRSRKTTVMVALQWGYCDGENNGGQFPNGLFPDLLADFVEKNGREIDWIFRLHPVQVRSRKHRSQVAMISKLQEMPNVWDFEASQAALSILLPKVDLLLTPSSGTASEALTMGVRVVFYDVGTRVSERLASQYGSEFSQGAALFWDGTTQLLTSILAQHASGEGYYEPLDLFDAPKCSDWLLEMIKRVQPGDELRPL